MVDDKKIPDGYKKTEVGVIPEDWEVRKIGEIAEITMGQSPDSKFYNCQNIGMPLIQGKADINNRKTLIRNYTSQITKIALKDDIIMTVRAPVGYIGKATVDCCIGRGVCSIRYKNNFLYHYLIYIENSWNKLSKGSTFDSVNSTEVKELKLKLPRNIEEQQAIAEALSDVDNLITSLEKLIDKKQKIKQGAMQELLTGKKRLPGFTGKWGKIHLGEIGKCIRGVSYNADKDLELFERENTVRLLRSNNILNNSIVNQDLQYVKYYRVRPQQVLKNNDIVICMANGSKELVGKAGVFKNKDKYRYTFGAFMGAFRFDSSIINKDFVAYYFETNGYRNQINLLFSGSSINNLKPSDIESICICLPTLEEQQAIAQILSDMDAEIENLQQKLNKYKAIKQGMMQELLTGRIRLV